MKRLLFFIALLCAATLSTSSTPTVTTAAGVATKERAVARFNQPVVLMGKTLQGEYLFVHDDEAMARGEACTYVYKGRGESKENLVVAFHCKPVQRDKASHFLVRSKQTATGLYELTEFQFDGSTEAHLIPAPLN